MPEFETDFEFEELCPVIDRIAVEGMMLFGTATLAQNDPGGNPEDFYVKEIRLNGGLRLTRSGDGALGFPDPFRKSLFHAATRQIEDDRTAIGRAAQEHFSAEVAESRQPDPDRAYDEMRDRQLMQAAE